MADRRSSKDIATEKGLPAAPDVERFILGAILLDGERINDLADKISEDDFAIEKHRRIWSRILDVWSAGENVDRVTVANELGRRGELASIDGLSYLVSLDEGLPQNINLDSYCRILKDKSALRQGAFLTQHAMNRFLLAEEPAEAIVSSVQDAVSALYLKLGTKQQTDFTTPMAAIEWYEGGINTFLNPSQRAGGTTTGFNRLDEMTGGLRDGDYAVVAARPGVGKSACASGIAWHVAWKLKKPVALFSLEMSIESLVTRMACAVARVDGHKFRCGYLNDDERARLRHAMSLIVSAPLFIDDNSSVTMAAISAKLRRLKAQQGKLGLVIVDYLQLMSGKAENRNQEITQLSRGMKLLANELGCPFLILSQLSRQTEMRKGAGARPQLSDLRDSGAIEQDADLVLAIYREEMYHPGRSDIHGKADFIILKQRSGPTGVFPMTFLHSYAMFVDRADESEEVNNGPQE